MAVSSSPQDVLSPLLARAPRLARLLPRLPRARFVEQSLRDLTMVATSLVRYRPVARTYTRADAKAGAEGATLTLLANEEIASGTRLLTFARPAGFAFAAGQFLTFRLAVAGGTGELRRSYSLCSAPDDDTLRIAVKRVDGGQGSAHLHALPVGSRLPFRGPSGAFTYAPRTEAHDLLLVAGGSGITPILSIVKTALAGSPAAKLTLLYAAQAPGEMAHRRELAELSAANPRLTLRCFFDRVGPEDVLSDHETVGRVGALDLASGAAPAALVYLCGPEPMMDSVSGALEAQGLAPEAIFRERFFTPRSAPLPARKDRVSLKLVDHGVDLPVDPRRTLLESTLEGGLAVPYSCTMGGCGECKAHLARGQVSMAEPNCLSRDERESGCILPCISYPLTDVELAYPTETSR